MLEFLWALFLDYLSLLLLIINLPADVFFNINIYVYGSTFISNFDKFSDGNNMICAVDCCLNCSTQFIQLFK